MGSPTSTVGLLCFTLLLTATPAELTAPQNGTDGALGMDFQELLGLFEVVGALLEDPNWTQMHPHPCSDTPWPGIQCELGQEPNPVLHVTKLHVGPDVASPPCRHDAKLSKSLLKLPYLKTLSIFSCFNTSKVSLTPSPFGAFSSLEQLVLKSNPGLVGKIPPNLAEFANLRVLSLSQNSLQGGIPKELGALGKLQQLDLSYNYLTGEIPEEIGSLVGLSILDLSWNRLKGHVPYSVGHLRSIQKIDLSFNLIFGGIPSDIGNLQRLVLLDLSHNFLSGPIPEALSNLGELEYLLLENNPIKTEVPTFLGTLEKLTVLSLSGCGLTGTIPTSLGSLNQLTALSLDRNNLSGTVPLEFGTLPNLGQLNLSQNLLSGELGFSQEFMNRLGNRLDVRGNKGLCIHSSFVQNISLNLGALPCLSSAKSSNGSQSREYGRDPDFGGLEPSWYDGKGSSTAPPVVNQRQVLLCLDSYLFVIFMHFF